MLGASLYPAAYPVPQAPPRIVTPEVTTSLNGTAVGVASVLAAANTAGGVLEMVAPHSLNGTAIPRGRIYAQAWLMDDSGNKMGTVWSGYLYTTSGTPAGPVSVPGIYIPPGWTIVAVATQTGQGAATRVGFTCQVTQARESARGAPGYIFSEAPGSGLGEVVEVTLAAPAAGADFATQTVPAASVWAPYAFHSQLTTSAVAGNRWFSIVPATSGSVTLCRPSMGAAVTASLTVRISMARGYVLLSSAGAPAWTSPLPDFRVKAGQKVVFATETLDAADQWAAARFLVEEWAVPS